MTARSSFLSIALLMGASSLWARPTAAQLQPADTETLPGAETDVGLGRAVATGHLFGSFTEDIAVLAENRLRLYSRDDTSTLEVTELGEFFDAGLGESASDAALAICDLEPGGAQELIVGAPSFSEDLPEAGAVLVFRLIDGVLDLTGVVGELDQNQADPLGDGAEAGDRFGAALTTGDFNNDGFCDLAIGAPGEDIGGVSDAGSAHVLLGPWDLISPPVFQPPIVQGSGGVGDTSSTGDHFGSVLAAGRLAEFGPGGDQLIIGAPEEDGPALGAEDEGAVWIVPFGQTGFDLASSQQLDPAIPGLGLQPFDHFGASLATGDLNGDGFDDLAVGVPDAAVVGANSLAGFVAVFDGRSSLPLVTDATRIDILDTGVASSPAEGFGTALAIGDINGDFYDDLAVGVPTDPAGGGRGTSRRGSVQIFSGGSDSIEFLQKIEQPDIPGEDNEQDRFGEVLLLADTRNVGTDELIVGVPREDSDTTSLVGTVHVIPGPSRLRRGDGLLLGLPFLANDRLGLAYSNGDGELVYASTSIGNVDSRLLSTVSPGELAAGVDIDAGGRGTGANQGLFTWFENDSQSIESSLGRLAEFAGPSPDGGTYNSLGSVRADDLGRAYWLGSSFATRLYATVPGSGVVDTLLSSTGVVDGVGVGDIDVIDVAHSGAHFLAHTDAGLVRSGSLVQRPDQPFPATGQQYLGTTNVSVNSSGAFAFNGRLVGGGTSVPDRFVTSAGSELANDVSLGADGEFFLEGLQATAVAVNDEGAVVGAFSSDLNGVVFLACDPSDLGSARPIVATGDWIDLSGGGFGLLEVVGVPDSRPEQPELQSDGGVFLRLEVMFPDAQNPDDPDLVFDALVALATGGCPFFADGFESGSISAWTTSRP